jgi:RNA polymerase sigma-70 factor (ECF subfamily)
MTPVSLQRPQVHPDLDPEGLVERFGDRIYALARRLVGNAADAEDVTQTVLVKLVEKAPTYRGEGAPMGWIYRITMNEAREHFRRRRRRPATGLDLEALAEGGGPAPRAPTVSLPAEPADAADVRTRVRAAVNRLPDGYREAVVLADLQGLGYREAAQLMNLDVNAFRTRLHRARLKLRGALGRLHRPGPAHAAA